MEWSLICDLVNYVRKPWFLKGGSLLRFGFQFVLDLGFFFLQGGADWIVEVWVGLGLSRVYINPLGVGL